MHTLIIIILLISLSDITVVLAIAAGSGESSAPPTVTLYVYDLHYTQICVNSLTLLAIETVFLFLTCLHYR